MKPKKTLVLGKAPKPIRDMTDAELDAYVNAIIGGIDAQIAAQK